MATTAQRNHIKELFAELWDYRAHCAYPPNDVRTQLDATTWGLSESQALTLLKAGHVLQWDCSEMAAWVLKCAGLWHWSTPGYTGTDLDVCQPHYSNAKEALGGALAIFGPGTGHHVAMVWAPDAKEGNPVMFSHGEPGIDRILLADEAARQAAMGYPGVTFCSIQHL